jgi:lambda repressor-like predicted transcriptional regulator
MDILDLLKNPAKAKIVLENAIIEKNKELAEILIPIVRDPYLTYKYAKKIVGGKIKDEWEEIIAQKSFCSYNYAARVLHGPFPKGEDAIAQDPLCSYNYAYFVLKGRFPKGEDIIATDSYTAYNYAFSILKSPFPKGENNISKNPDYAYLYAKDVLKGPFPKGEDAIAKEAPLALSYAKEILKNRFKKGEDAIIKSEIENPDNDWSDDGESCFTSYVKFLKSINKLDEFLKDHPEAKLWI